MDTTNPLASDLVRLLLTPQQAADALGVSLRKLRYMAATGEIPHVCLGRLTRYDPRDLKRWIKKTKRIGRVKQMVRVMKALAR